ncbi:AraC family transcriptional regulator [Paenibacillus eucommiae]|uniref:AraC-like DNA-binding protein n=1 Tax=Paenibacillus eucommiae TaxID=1355755 RepID=A0ABS4J888_9BACL|nr:AraC family transcriptional regulator [Paenibacillus eucommiae]MBP1996072.1 AraC-like DNA-binding protein [Paenibacillus eucommiae]
MNHLQLLLPGSLFWQPEFPMCVTREREFFSLAMHVHDFIEINYVAEGKGFHYIGEERLQVQRGDLFIIPIGTAHVYRPVSPHAAHELIVYNCLFSTELLHKLLKAHALPAELEQMLTEGNGEYRYFKDSQHEFRPLMEQLFKEHSLRLSGYEPVLCGLLLQLLIGLYRCEKQVHRPGASFHQLQNVFEYMAKHYAEPISLEHLAGMIPISVSYLQRLFKRTTGQSITEYLQNLRIEKSCELLQRSPLSVRDIASQIGYKDLKFFHALFKKKTGFSPYQYRKKANL